MTRMTGNSNYKPISLTLYVACPTINETCGQAGISAAKTNEPYLRLLFLPVWYLAFCVKFFNMAAGNCTAYNSVI
jgi:hypothetical protein